MTMMIRAIAMPHATPDGIREPEGHASDFYEELDAFAERQQEAELRQRHATALVRSERRQQRGRRQPARPGFSRERIGQPQ